MNNIEQTELFDSLTFMPSGYHVRAIQKQQTHHLLLNVHYAKRIPPISFAFGLFLDGNLAGVITYGMPASPSLCKGVAGPNYKDKVLELNRLCLVHNRKGEGSKLVAISLRLLPKPLIVVSYADTSQSHIGTVYQASNWIYTGSTKPRTEIAVRGLEHMHSKALSNKGSKEWLIEQYGDEVYQRPRAVKHRYLYFLGNKEQVKAMRDALRYPVLPYPKSARSVLYSPAWQRNFDIARNAEQNDSDCSRLMDGSCVSTAISQWSIRDGSSRVEHSAFQSRDGGATPTSSLHNLFGGAV